MATTPTPSQFRAFHAPRFDDEVKYPDTSVTTWLTMATRLVSEDRWGDSWSIGVFLYTAHQLSLGALMEQEAAMGGVQGMRTGAISSESGDGVSVSFDNSATNMDGGGHFNQTMYGKQYLQLARLHGAGPVQVGADNMGSAGSAWPGVVY